MKPAEFEEREYEAPLYNQLERGSPNVWAPGLVFEGHIGLDRGLFILDPWIFRLHGYASYPPGAALSRYRWPAAWFARQSPRRLPGFRLNLFIQAKRPVWGQRPPAAVRTRGVTGRFWRFAIDKQQHAALGAVAAKLRARALVVYACAAFHEHSQLFAHTCRGTIAANSTFPSVLSLSGHDAWYYNKPGATGVANPDPTAIEEPSLDARIVGLLEGEIAASDSWRLDLDILARNIHDALAEETLVATSRVAAFFDLLRRIQRETEDLEERSALSSFLTVAAFSEVFLVNWYVVG